MGDAGEIGLRLCLGVTGTFVAALVTAGWRELSRRRRAAAIEAADRALDADDACAACGSTNLVELGERVYVCPDCGYEGGEGYAAFDTARRRDRLRALPEDERARLAAERRVEARRLLTTALGDFERLRPQIAGEVRARDPREFHAWEAELLQAFQWTREGLAALDEARVLEGAEDPGMAGLLDRIEPRMWYANELGAEVDLTMVRVDVQAAVEAADRALRQLEAR